MKLRIYGLSLLALLAFSVSLFGQTVDEIIQKNIEALGGYKKWKALKTIKMSGTIFTQGLEMPFIRYGKRPNLMRVEATMQGQTMVQAYDGKTAWWIFPFMGTTEPQKMPNEQAQDIIQQADFDGPLFDYKKKGNKIELMGKEDVEGTEAYKLKVTLKNGKVIYSYLDSEYYLEIKQKAKSKRQEAALVVETNIGDYKEENGFMMPHSLDIIAGPQKTHLTIEKIEFNVKLGDDLFQMPKKKQGQ
ncbi:MAG: outer membrane lipoprotein-sorting protein [Calditrichaeota bacterium]|nr:MAG: outer membrane lipoprotein-sorting protein [Calditrichota bacterium]